MHIIKLRAFRDNYIYIIEQPKSQLIAVVDPGEALTVLNYARVNNKIVSDILITHYHADHTGGIGAILEVFPKAKVWGNKLEQRLKNQNLCPILPNSTITILDMPCNIIDIHAHTKCDIGYLFIPSALSNHFDLFSGDVIFGCTCGAIFEGTIDDMFGALQLIRSLNSSTRIWCAHEYTKQYVAAAQLMEPWNKKIAQKIQALKNNNDDENLSTVPLILAEEIEVNPYLRWDFDVVTKHYQAKAGIECFRKIIEAG